MSTKFEPPARPLQALRREKAMVNRAERIPRLERLTLNNCVEPESLREPRIGTDAEAVTDWNEFDVHPHAHENLKDGP